MSIKDLCHQLSSSNNESINGALTALAKRTRNASDVSELYEYLEYIQLHSLLKSSDGRYVSPVLSILANCTNVCERWRSKLRDNGGIQMIVELLQTLREPSILARCARLIANLAKDSSSLLALQDKFIINSLITTGSSQNTKCQMACFRALRMVCINKRSAKMAAECDKFPHLLNILISTEHNEVMLLCLRMICELLKTRVPEVCFRFVECELLAKILEFIRNDKEELQNICYEILFHLSLNSACRVTVAMEGALDIFVDRLQTLDQSESFKFAVQSICLNAREAVSRNKIKSVGALPCLVRILSDENMVCYHEAIVAAFVMYIFDDSSLGILIRAGVIPSILKYLDRLTGIEFSKIQEYLKSESVEKEEIRNTSEVVPNTSEVVSSTETPLPEVTPEIPIPPPNYDEICGYDRQQRWSSSSPETSPYHAGSPSYFVPHVPHHGCSPSHSPYSYSSQPSYSPPHSPYGASYPQYSPQHSPMSQASPQHSAQHRHSAQHFACYSPQHSPQHSAMPQTLTFSPQHFPLSPPCYSPQHPSQAYQVIEDDAYSDPLNDSSCSSEQVPYHHQSADGLYAMIHGTRGPVHDTLLLLSRFSQAKDPSSFFLVLPEFNHLLNYLLLSYNPKPKCARILNRLTQNSHCFDIILKEKLMPRLYLRLCTGWSLEHLVKLFDNANNKLKSKMEDECDEVDLDVDDNLCKWKLPSQETLSLGNLLISNIRSQCDSSYGKGVLSHILLSGSKLLKEKVLVTLPHIVRSMRLKRRVFWELKAAHLLMDMISSFPEIDSEMFVLNVEAICALSHLVGIACEKLPDVRRTACIIADNDEGVETDVEPPSKRRKLEKTETRDVDSKVILFKLPSGKIVPCDSKYLITHSQVFERMLSQTYIDSKKPYINISNVNENAFLKLIHFMCGCQVKLDVFSCCEGVCVHKLKYGDIITMETIHPLLEPNDKNNLLDSNIHLNPPKLEGNQIDAKDISGNIDESSNNSVESKMKVKDVGKPFDVKRSECSSIYETTQSEHPSIDETTQSEPPSIDETMQIERSSIDEITHQCSSILDEFTDEVAAGTHMSMYLDDSLKCEIELLGCCERFFVDELKSTCERLLINSTSADNVVDLFFLSCLYNSFPLKRHTFNYLLTSIESPMIRTKCFAEILHSNEKDAFLGSLRSEFVERLCRQET